MRLHSALLITAALVGSPACSPPPPSPPSTAPTASGGGVDPKLAASLRQYERAEMTADLSGLPAQERQALARIVEAAGLFDGLFLQQVWADNPSMLMRLASDHTPQGQALLHYFMINKGPWDRIDHHKPFVPGAPDKPPMGNHYPADSTKEEVDAWFNSLPAARKAEATGFFSVIRRGSDHKLMSIPYNVAYQNTLLAVSAKLKEAAALTAQPTLKKFLDLRAEALLSNDYFASDMAWMELDASIEPTIGPYETYEDEWFGYKAGFEAFIGVRDDAETAKLSKLGAELQGLEDALPIDPSYRSPKLGGLAPLRVVNSVFSAGDGNRGIQTTAYNLPNDDRVIKEKGSKRVMLKNVQEAKFKYVLAPISKVALAPADAARVSFDAFFTHTVMHELMHGLGPQQVKSSGQGVRLALKDTYAAIEEAKADISGLWALQQLADKGVISKEVADAMYPTFLASAFRSIRFGVTEAHGKGVALQLNDLLDRGAFVTNPDGTFAVVDAKIREAVKGLTHDLMTIEALGSYSDAQALLAKAMVIRPEVQRVLDKLKDVPVDIEPAFLPVQ